MLLLFLSHALKHLKSCKGLMYSAIHLCINHLLLASSWSVRLLSILQLLEGSDEYDQFVLIVAIIYLFVPQVGASGGGNQGQ